MQYSVFEPPFEDGELRGIVSLYVFSRERSVVDFRLVIIELSSVTVMAKALRVEICRNRW